MPKALTSVFRSFLFLLLIVESLAIPADAQQRERRVDTREQGADSRFIEQLRSLFGRFRDGDLSRAFDSAQPVQCSELVSDTGEWRSVAFFNEDRRLGDWYHQSLDEVKADLSQFIFSGTCDTDQSSVQLVTKVPVLDSLDRYRAGRIRFNEIRMVTNPGVRVTFNSRTKVYAFDLPYLYVNRARSGRELIYTSMPQSVDDRYVPDMTNGWECKSVRATDVTFHFMICMTWTAPRGTDTRRSNSRESFGAYAYFVLSDGKEATTSAKLSFNIDDKGDPKPEKAEPTLPQREDQPRDPGPDAEPERSVALWQIPEPSAKMAEIDKAEFRILFSPQTWAGKVNAGQVLTDQKISALDPSKQPASTVDSCVWRPGTTPLVSRVLSKEPDMDVDYSLSVTSSISIDMKTHTGTRLGSLQCSFPKADLSAVTFERWVNVVGAHLTIEVRP